MVRRGVLAGVGLLVVLSSGCGGGGGDRYTLDTTRACLQKNGYPAAELANRYLPGSDGNLRVRLARSGHTLLSPGGAKGTQFRDYVFLVFDKNGAEALKTQEKAITFAVSSLRSQSVLMSRAAVKRGVAVAKNVFYYSATGALSTGERARVAACLR